LAARKILILVGEASGDLQGAQLVRELRLLAPELDLVAMGGARLRDAGARLLLDTTSQGFIGVWEAVCGYPALLRLFARVKQLIRSERPDHVVFVDAPGFNMRLAPYVRSLGIPSTYYFPPSAWVPDVGRARQVARQVDHVIAAFEYTASTYRQAGVPVAYFGHPLLDATPGPLPVEVLVEQLGLPRGKRYVGLFPGSRHGEITRLLPRLLDAARLLAAQHPELCFVLPVAVHGFGELVRAQVSRYPDVSLCVVEGRGTDCMAACELLLMASGSASLEATILGVPMVLTYRLSAFDWALAPFVMRSFSFMGLPNLLAQRYIVPELLQEDATGPRIALEASQLLRDARRAARMRESLAEVRTSLGSPGVTARVARYLWERALQ
jgi:lipid-A-disaccharide synthase